MTALDQQEADDLDEHAGFWPPEVYRQRGEWLRRRLMRMTPEGVITFAVVVLSAALVFWQLHPSKIFLDTTPAGGDMGAHVWLPAFVKRALLPHLQLTGWTPDWYDGFPALTYYFPLPIVSIALLSYVIQYNIAFKIVASIGLVLLPLGVWSFARSLRMKFPLPAVMAAASLPFIFSREFTIYGGNIASTMAGEFCFSISLAFAFFFLGRFAKGLDTGRHRASAAVLLACCGLSHILPLFFALGGAAVLTLMKIATTRDWRRLRFALPVGITGGLLIGFWAFPFYWRLPYATNMGYGKYYNYLSSLTHNDDILIGLAAAAFLISCVRFNFLGVWLGLMSGLAALGFILMPAQRLWNARILPFWFLCLYLLIGVLIYEVGTICVQFFEGRPDGLPRRVGATLAIPVLALIGMAVFVLYPIPSTPSGNDVFGLTPTNPSFVSDWVNWNYDGYQDPGKQREQEYAALMAKMGQVGRADGCGQALWEYEPSLNEMGTPDALMLLPYWTNGCIGSEEGLYYESSATTPYHFINVSETSNHPPDPVTGLDYGTLNIPQAVQQMQIMGDRYFMANSPNIVDAANADPALRLVATVGPFSYPDEDDSTSSTPEVSRTWSIYQLVGWSLVSPLANQPAVMTGIQSKNPSVWLDAAERWYNEPQRWNVFEAAEGPAGWPRVPATDTQPPVTPEPTVLVTNVVQKDESISFDVNQTGVPILVRESYFPNWQVHGASAVYRVTPNLMVVVPTSNHVELYYGYTPVDWIGLGMTGLGLVTALLFWRSAPVAFSAAVDQRRRRWPWADPDDDRAGGFGPDGGPDPHDPGSAAEPSAGGAGPGKVAGRMPAPDVIDRIFKAYDIRGTYPDQIDADVARAVGASFARFAGTPTVLVARDMRPSGPELVAAFAEGATAAGADVVDLGLCSTDEMYFASGWLDAPGAMFTASHNPAQYNGIKLCLAGARPVGADTGLDDVKAGVVAYLGGDAAPSGHVGTTTTREVLGDYAAKVRSFVDTSRLRPLKIVADTANGMGGLVVPAVFEGLPFDYEILFPELDGTFPNHPADPIQPENLRALRDRILETGADVGLAFDGDADRCFLVDDLGQPVSGSTTTAMVAAAMLEKHPGSTVLHNLICSKAVPEIVRERGGRPVRTRVGHSYIKAVMADTDALFGGEHSGHYYFRDNFRADSGAIAALVVLEGLSTSPRKLSEIRKDFERYADSGEINTEVDDPVAVIEAVAAHYESTGAQMDRLDGLTVDLGDWWFNLRPSNTEPLLRLNLEAPDSAACEARTAEVLTLIRGGSGAQDERKPK
jgi:phosphomannomutase